MGNGAKMYSDTGELDCDTSWMEWAEAALSGGVWTGHGRLAATAVTVAQ